MKPFDLNAAINGAKLVTRDGREVTEFYYFKTAENDEHPCIAVINKEAYPFSIIGKCHEALAEEESDLFLKSEKKKLWILIKKHPLLDKSYETTHAYDCEQNLTENDKKIFEQVEVEISV